MIYRGAERRHGWIIQQSEGEGRQWVTSKSYGPYQHKKGCMAMVYKLRREEKMRPDNMAAMIMSSKRFCVVAR